jgi:2'-5' RNA ligase
MKLMVKYGIAIFPSKQLQDIANSYRKRYDPHYTLIPPHITIKGSFHADDNRIENVIKEVRKIANSTNPFPLQVYKVGSFHPVTNTIYLGVRTDETLLSLQNKLNSGPLEQAQEFSFVPHITIGQKMSDAEHSDVLESMKMMNVNHEEIVDRFQLLYQLENGSWTVYETFHLGEDC